MSDYSKRSGANSTRAMCSVLNFAARRAAIRKILPSEAKSA